jgi:predicted component of type VI protein secretion system
MRKKPKPAATSATAPVARVEVDAAPGAAADWADGDALAAEPVAAAAPEPDEEPEPEAERAAERDETALEMALETLETDEPDTVADAVEAAEAPEAGK